MRNLPYINEKSRARKSIFGQSFGWNRRTDVLMSYGGKFMRSEGAKPKDLKLRIFLENSNRI